MTLAIKIGDSIVLDGAKYRMLHRSLSGELCFQDWENGNVRQISEDSLLEKYMSGQAALWVRTEPQIKGWEEKNLRLDFGSLSPGQQEEARRCKAYVDAIMTAGRPARRAETWPSLIDVTARTIADPNKPSWQTVSRWLRRYLASRCDIRSLLSGNAAKGRRRAGRDPGEMKVLNEALSLWLTEEQPTKQWVYDQVEAAYARARRETPGASAWKMPCRATVYRMLEDIDLYERVRRREGKRAADYLFDTVEAGKPAAYRLEVVEIDHTRADVWVIDPKSGYLLGRPWITIAIDRYTRMIVGVYIGFEPPSTHSVMQCLRNMILPKAQLMRELGIQELWNPFGCPVMVVVDNAQEFVSDAMRNAAAALGITIAQQPVNRPEFKGIVERVVRTIKESGLTWMPGKVRTFAKDSRGYDPTKFACITLEEFRTFFFRWLTFEYTHATHTGIMDIPGRRWAEEVERNPVFVPNHVSDLDALLGIIRTGKIGRRGIRFRNLFYQNTELARIRANPRLPDTVRFAVDPGDLGQILVTHPEDQKTFSVPAAIPAYANGLTLYQHNMIRAFIHKRNKSYESQADLVEGRLLLREASLELLKRSKTKNRSKVTRQLGIGVNQPTNDLTRLILGAENDPDLQGVASEDVAEDTFGSDPDSGPDQADAANGSSPAAKESAVPKAAKNGNGGRKARTRALPEEEAAGSSSKDHHETGNHDDVIDALPVIKRSARRNNGATSKKPL